MTPTTLARYIAHGISAVDPFDLPAILDALWAERAIAIAQRAVPDPDVCVTIHAVNRIDAAIARIEHHRNPSSETAAAVQDTAERVAYDACACVGHR